MDVLLEVVYICLYRYASCCWISLNQGGGSWEIRVRMNLAPRSDNGLINSSPITNMPPIVRVQRQCNNRIAVPGEVMVETVNTLCMKCYLYLEFS